MEPCANCKSQKFGFKYKCPPCHEFYLCPKCAFLPLTKNAENHDHPLNLLQKLLPFTCDHCLKKDNSMPYFCPTCLFMVHPEFETHDHLLTLVQRFMISLTCDACGNEIKGRVCQLCAKTVDTNYWAYCCSSQDFIAHLHCATSKEEKDKTFVLNSKDEESIGSSTTSMLKHEEDHPYKSIDLTEIKHFSHEHYLKLTDEFGIDKRCDACIRSVFPPFYARAQCGFFLHKLCAELPKKLQHSLHQHPLKLIFLREQKPFRCDGCWHPCNGFNYRCDECNFDLDVLCSLILDILIDPSPEQHQLILARSSENKMCSSCGSHRKHKFSCVDCEFTLDFKCLTLPHMTNYKEHDHPFILCYTSEDNSGEYYCDICEGTRDPKCRFYYCADCSYPAHPECILEKYPNLKYERTFKYNIHQHPLALMKNYPPSRTRGNSCNNLDFECALFLIVESNEQLICTGFFRFS
ncbi:hypothetical protein I3843_07G011600 [Carya illinoinensis]|nr:hypothetical protein I3843_07G011600 [Carya illinoinensis]